MITLCSKQIHQNTEIYPSRLGKKHSLQALCTGGGIPWGGDPSYLAQEKQYSLETSSAMSLHSLWIICVHRMGQLSAPSQNKEEISSLTAATTMLCSMVAPAGWQSACESLIKLCLR